MTRKHSILGDSSTPTSLKTATFKFAASSLLTLTLVAFGITGTAVAQSYDDDGSSETTNQQTQTDETQTQAGNDVYKGVTPGVHDVVEHSRVSKIRSSASKELTWVGYQKQAGKDRVFFQFSEVPYYDVKQNGQLLVITFEDTAPTAKNFERLIDTSAFKSRVKSIATDYKKGKTTVKIKFSGENNSVASTEDGYLFFDFPK